MRYIYVVDDDGPMRASLRSLLSTRKNTLVRGFESGDAFLADVAELEPGVVLLDVNMPGRSGLEVLRELKSEGSRFVPIVITGQGNVAMAVHAMKHGALDFVEKPYGHRDLLEIVDTAFIHLEQSAEIAEREKGAKDKIGKLSARELDVLMGLIAGRPNKVIAYELEISPRTVEIYRANLMTKLKVRSLSEALRIAFAAGLISDE
ncbi:two-component system response regulator FixJ [Sphingomonas vulcanisoli]|uniref:Two-component system response regulator FixJ n=1 Tax=Sphingomonas vulcanisoli TaxID=1658060 RepID=A0ABX0TSK2_9SPHN|nr:response regulator [Sphingomonas vulcanisoli]NIJ07362.1 two-component system response regulator FixJ [Sphingomonas vulcanisoli]